MDNYKVKAMVQFNDYGGKDINNPNNPFVLRTVGEEFNCTAERYLFLKEKGAVELIEIVPIEVPTIKNVDEAMERIKQSSKEETKKAKKKK